MAGVFFSSPYLKGGKQSAKLANLTKYISTREGVELIKDTDSSLPATKQQQGFISRLLKMFPDTREMPEYEDYNAEHSQKNAAEFISQVQENYVQQTAYRDQLQENALEVMESLIQKMQDGEISNPKLELLITELAERLQNYTGKKVYGYLPPATKRIVAAIVDELAGDERIAEAYSLWQDMRDEVFSFYSKAKPKRVPLSQQKEFKPVRNMVIREVVQMMEQLQPQNVERNDEWSRTVPEPKVVAENSAPSSTRSAPQPESVAACMVRMLHHMGNIFRDNVGTTGYRGLQLDRKRRKELQEWKIALGHREDDHEDPANYPTQSY